MRAIFLYKNNAIRVEEIKEYIPLYLEVVDLPPSTVNIEGNTPSETKVLTRGFRGARVNADLVIYEEI